LYPFLLNSHTKNLPAKRLKMPKNSKKLKAKVTSHLLFETNFVHEKQYVLGYSEKTFNSNLNPHHIVIITNTQRV